jgi:ATP-dependent DNA helicase RecG
MNRDRLEIKSPGGLYGKITIDSLGKVHPDTRNAALANILELLGVTENRYSGIPTIRYECRNMGIPAPIFEVRRGEFKVTFKNAIHKDRAKKNRHTVRNDLLEFCSTPKTRSDIIEFTGFSRFYTMNSIVQPLIDKGILKMSNPAKPKSSKQTYVTA